MIPVMSLVYEVVSMTLGYFSDAAKVSSLMKDCGVQVHISVIRFESHSLHAEVVKGQQILIHLQT